MPDMMNLPQPSHAAPLRQSKECPGGRSSHGGFPEYLKHMDVLGDQNTKLKLSGSNSLFHAVLKGRLRGTHYLLERTASVNGRNDYGHSVLTAALHVDDDKRRQQLFRLLLERGADPFFRDASHQRNVLHWACLMGRVQQVRTLLREVGGDVELGAKDKDMYTALHYAVMEGHMPVVILLVAAHRKFGVSVDMPDKMGLTPYNHAKRLGFREVAEHLHTEGQASQGHGDALFRTPREWSQIGKFERQKAIEDTTQDAINAAKIKGKITHVRHLEDSLNHLAAKPTAHPRRHHHHHHKHHPHRDRLSRSLPSLKEPLPRLHLRPSSANGQAETDGGGGDEVDNAQTTTTRSTKEAFVDDPAHQSSRDPLQAAAAVAGAGTGSVGVAHSTASTSMVATTASLPEGTTAHATTINNNNTGTNTTRSLPKRSNSLAALSMMEMDHKGRHARHYRQSQFDETKASEYQHMLGNLNSIMDILAQQQSKSFRQSVKVQQPETPTRKKSKSKVSSLAVIFGRDKTGQRGQKKLSPKSSAQPGRRAKGKDQGDQKKVKAAASERRKVVPLLKVNDKLM
ncbi:uncharacterized protein LOC143292094 [Babylonia areolata]|uniref:uncharacterized protein LOC143292094 n=1 Tax=Babylonia areolata TaxID=304850 RepID=UPI003FD540A2